MNTLTAPLPPKVTATPVDVTDAWTVYRLADTRGYTHRFDTIRVGKYNNAGDYRIEAWRNSGWTTLAEGRDSGDDEANRVEGVARAITILFGLEDHG